MLFTNESYWGPIRAICCGYGDGGFEVTHNGHSSSTLLWGWKVSVPTRIGVVKNARNPRKVVKRLVDYIFASWSPYEVAGRPVILANPFWLV
jgi:hypothetical protein